MRQKCSESARELYERDQQSVNRILFRIVQTPPPPPSTPVISRTDGLAYPYLAGDRVEMTCDTQPSRGNPAASLSWSGHGGGQTETPSGAPATLLFPSVGRNRRNVFQPQERDVPGKQHLHTGQGSDTRGQLDPERVL